MIPQGDWEEIPEYTGDDEDVGESDMDISSSTEDQHRENVTNDVDLEAGEFNSGGDAQVNAAEYSSSQAMATVSNDSGDDIMSSSTTAHKKKAAAGAC